LGCRGRLQKHETAILTYESLLHRNASLSAAAFHTAARAAAFCRPVAYTLQILENAHRVLGDGCMDVVDSALTSRAHAPQSTERASDVTQILDWLQSRGLTPSTEIIVRRT
jgi:hypothetical protein